MGYGVLVGVISSDVECPLVIFWGTPTGDRHNTIGILHFLLNHVIFKNGCRPVYKYNGFLLSAST